MRLSLFSRNILFALLSVSLLLTSACTSSDEDKSILEAELENMDAGSFEEGETLEGGDLADIENDELADELDAGDNFDEFGDSGDDEFAEFDEDDNFEDEFNESDEQALAKELGNGSQAYPEANAQPTFPEEVIGSNSGSGPTITPIPPQQPMDPAQPPPNQYITSETVDIVTEEDPPIPQDDLGKADPINPEEAEFHDNQNLIPVVKIKTDPFFRNERLMNTVYIARPKDTLDGISQKIFGSDKSAQLQNDNPHLSKGIDVGDKVYYTSPNRADDKTLLKVYYDDIGLESQKYVTGKGENIRQLGSKLLGFPDGWKEIWAINQNIDSKTILPAGTEIRYWTGEEQPVQTIADEPAPEVPDANNPETAQGSMETPDEMPPADNIEPPPTSPVVSELPPEPPLPEASMAIPADESIEPEIIPEIEPMPEEGFGNTPPSEVATVSQPQQGTSLITIGALALLILGAAALVAIQIKNRKAQTTITPPSLEYTQV